MSSVTQEWTHELTMMQQSVLPAYILSYHRLISTKSRQMNLGHGKMGISSTLPLGAWRAIYSMPIIPVTHKRIGRVLRRAYKTDIAISGNFLCQPPQSNPAVKP